MKDLLNKIPWALLALLYVGYMGWDYYGFAYGNESPLAAKKNQIVQTKQEIAQLEKKVHEIQDFARNLEVKKVELKRTALELDAMKSTLSDTLDASELFETVLTEAKRVGMLIYDVKPLKMAKKEFYAEQGFAISYHGSYRQMIAFFERLANLQRLVRVENYSIKIASVPPSGVLKPKQVELDAVTEVKTYSYIGSRADEISKTTASSSVPSGQSSKPPVPGNGAMPSASPPPSKSAQTTPGGSPGHEASLESRLFCGTSGSELVVRF